MNPIFNTDAYKLSHKKFETEGTEYTQANMTPRSFRLSTIDLEGAVVFGTQRMVKKLIKRWNKKFFKRSKKKVINEAYRIFKPYLGMSREDLKHFEDLHDLGYLPLMIRGLPEGTIVDEKMPILTIINTVPGYAWLVTYLETWISTEMWAPMTTATNIYHFRKLCNKWANVTTGSTIGTEFQLHDFSYRGQGPNEAGPNGLGFLLSSYGTDTIPAILEAEKYYNANIETELVAASVPATEHSVTCVGIAVKGEKATIRNWITKDFPTGIVSIVADTLDFFKVITEYAADLKEDILNRKPNELGLAKVVFRPDSGDPVKILTGYKVYKGVIPDDMYEAQHILQDFRDGKYEVIEYEGNYYEINVFQHGVWLGYETGRMLSFSEVRGAVECLWDEFGGTTTEQGYKVLHERVGLIYGDSITYDRAERIFERLAAKGFASINCVLGVGSYTIRYVTRDTLGSAIKVTYAMVNGEEYSVQKDPVTDSGVKKSACGYLDVVYNPAAELELVEYASYRDVDHTNSAYVTYVKSGTIYHDESLEDIRYRLWN